jgi:hypothetical protein
MQSLAQELQQLVYCCCEMIGIEQKVGSRKKAGADFAPAVQLVVCPEKTWDLHAAWTKNGSRGAGIGKLEGSLYQSLRAAPRPNRQIAHLCQNARHLHRVQLRQIRHDLRHKLVLDQFAHFFLAVAFAA